MTCDGNCIWHRKFDALEADFENLELDILVKRRQIAELKARLEEQELAKVESPLVQALFDYWRLLLRDGRKSVKLGEKRRQAIKGRLREGYTAQQLMAAIDGALREAFEKDGKRYDDLELILRNEVQVERFIGAQQRWVQYRDAHHRAHGYSPEMAEPVDTSDRNLARLDELSKVRRYLQEHRKEGT